MAHPAFDSDSPLMILSNFVAASVVIFLIGLAAAFALSILHIG